MRISVMRRISPETCRAFPRTSRRSCSCFASCLSPRRGRIICPMNLRRRWRCSMSRSPQPTRRKGRHSPAPCFLDWLGEESKWRSRRTIRNSRQWLSRQRALRMPVCNSIWRRCLRPIVWSWEFRVDRPLLRSQDVWAWTRPSSKTRAIALAAKIVCWSGC